MGLLELIFRRILDKWRSEFSPGKLKDTGESPGANSTTSDDRESLGSSFQSQNYHRSFPAKCCYARL